VSDQFLEHFLPGETVAMQQLRETIAKINRRYRNPPHMGRAVLIVGETGAGKNYVARVIAGHLYWLNDPERWQAKPPEGSVKGLREVTGERFAEVALPAIPDELIESALFGHVKGAFTGASTDKTGYFGSDEISDLLLDEIGDASAPLQVKLLQVLNDRSFRRVGAEPTKCEFTEARIMFATNRDIGSLVRAGTFRSDLYWRMQHLILKIPPLREQRDRIPDLANHLVARILREHEAPEGSLALTKRDVQWAKEQPWPGNIRELERLLWRWVYENGEHALEDIQRSYPAEDLAESPSSADLRAVVRERIQRALHDGRTLAATAGEFTKSVEREIQYALYQIKAELKLDKKQLEILFKEGERAAKQISAWGTSRDAERDE
jgi:DNA-binding NtrC family response regulator